jgi:hypothetical protein
MTTQSQILANRRNAQKSTGPRTAEGKAAVAKNATKHGLFARKDVVISENQADFDAFRDDMLAELAPAGTMESLLAARIVSLTWRLKRAERMQNEVVDAKIRREINSTFPKLSETLITGKPCDVSKYSEDCYDDLALGYIAMWDFAEQRALERLSMYERRFEASLFRTMGEFKKLQHARKLDRPETVETKVGICRGRDARETQGRDALATVCQTQGRDALATVCQTQGRDALATVCQTQGRDALATVCQTQGRDALATEEGRECAKQSQSAAAQNDLSSFERTEYELLTRTATGRNKANFSQPRTEISRQKAEVGGRRTEKGLRRQALPFDKLRAGVCRY